MALDYTTKSGDTWDLIALNVYGSELKADWLMLNRLTEMSENGEIHYLIIGFAPVSQNKFRVTEISDSWDSVIKHGLLMQCKVSLTIKEYI